MSGPTVWIVLFRGVGGKTQLPVARLRQSLAEAGFKHVATYINSGNAVVTTPLSRQKATARIAEICRKEFGFDKDIHLISEREWRQLMDGNPFPEALETPRFLHVAWLAEKPDPARVEALREVAQISRDSIEVVGRVAYLYTPDGFGTSKLAEKFDRGIGVANTARNWNTVVKLAELAGR